MKYLYTNTHNTNNWWWNYNNWWDIIIHSTNNWFDILRLIYFAQTIDFIYCAYHTQHKQLVWYTALIVLSTNNWFDILRLSYSAQTIGLIYCAYHTQPLQRQMNYSGMSRNKMLFIQHNLWDARKWNIS